MAEIRIQGDVTYPETGSRWVDNTDDSRTLTVEAVEPGDWLGREIRGTLRSAARVGRVGGVGHVIGQPYATDIRTFNAVWVPLGQPVATS